MDWKTLIFGIVLIIVLGVGGLVYRNAVEHASQPIACPTEAKVCPDGTSVAREGLSCTFPACPPPNVSLDAAGIAFALPAGFSPMDPNSAPGDGTPGLGALLAAYSNGGAGASSTDSAIIVIRSYAIAASSTPLATISKTAIGGASGAPIPKTAYSSTNIAGRQYTVVEVERLEGVIDTSYYLARGPVVLRFDAIDRGADWTNPALDTASLPAHAALRQMLATLQAE